MEKQLTKNFNSKEFECKDGTEVPNGLMHNVQKLAENLQKIRDYGGYGKPITIISGYRTNSHNQAVKGAKQSYHLKGMASDIKMKGWSAKDLYVLIHNMMDAGLIEKGGIILYRRKGFVHYDIRGYKMTMII